MSKKLQESVSLAECGKAKEAAEELLGIFEALARIKEQTTPHSTNARFGVGIGMNVVT